MGPSMLIVLASPSDSPGLVRVARELIALDIAARREEVFPAPRLLEQPPDLVSVEVSVILAAAKEMGRVAAALKGAELPFLIMREGGLANLRVPLPELATEPPSADILPDTSPTLVNSCAVVLTLPVVVA